MDADDRVRILGRPGQHAFELGAADPIDERAAIRLDLLDDPLVAFRFAHFEQLGGVRYFAREVLDCRDLLFDGGALAEQRLGFRLVVPEVGRGGELIQLFELAFEVRYVKDAPLAHQRAF